MLAYFLLFLLRAQAADGADFPFALADHLPLVLPAWAQVPAIERLRQRLPRFAVRFGQDALELLSSCCAIANRDVDARDEFQLHFLDAAADLLR